MLLTITDLSDYTIQATDGEIGSVAELYFQQEDWRVRYLVVNVGNWLTRQQVLLVPDVVTNIDGDNKSVAVDLTRQQVEESPDILTDMPVSREREAILHQHYQWRPYWTGHPSEGMTYGTNAIVQDMPGQSLTGRLPQEQETGAMDTDDGFRRQLRSTDAVTGYYIQAIDDNIGHVEDFVVNTETWRIGYLIIDTRNWLPGRKVLIAVNRIHSIQWENSEVKVALTKESIKNSPEYEPGLLDKEYTTRLQAHYDN